MGVSLVDEKTVSEVKWNCLKEAGEPHCTPVGCRQPVSVNPKKKKKQIKDESILCCITNRFHIASIFVPLGEHSLAAQTDNFPFAFSTCESEIGEI